MRTAQTAIGGTVTSNIRPDQSHLTALYDAHVRDVYRYVHRMSLDHAIAEDVTQDVFLAAAAALRSPTVADNQISIAWLIRSARNRLIDILRRETNYQRKLASVERTIRSNPVDETQALVDTLRVKEALGALRPLHRIVLMMHYVDGLSVSDLATELERSYKGAEGLLSRARAALRLELEEGE